MSQGQVNDIKNNAQFLGFKNDRGVIPLCYDFPCKNIKIIWNLRRCWLKKVIFVFIFFGLAFVEERFMRSKRTCFCFPQTVICYLLSVTQKNHFWKLSTVTLGSWNWRCPKNSPSPRVSRIRNLFFLSKNCNTVSCKNRKSWCPWPVPVKF